MCSLYHLFYHLMIYIYLQYLTTNYFLFHLVSSLCFTFFLVCSVVVFVQADESSLFYNHTFCLKLSHFRHIFYAMIIPLFHTFWQALFIYFSQFISFFYFILSILYTIFKFIVNLDFFDIGISFNLN